MAQYSLRELKFAILKILENSNHQHKVNIIGRGFSTGEGSLERLLGVSFDPETRALADKAFEEIKAGGLIRPTYRDIIHPDLWVEIADQGRAAYCERALDSLDKELNKLDPHLVEIRDGAWSSLRACTPDSTRQAAHSARELILQTLRKAAPDDTIKSQSGFIPESRSRSGITRRHRIRFILENSHGRVSDTVLRIVESACSLVESVHDALTAAAHADSTPEMLDVEDAIRTSEMALRRLLVPK